MKHLAIAAFFLTLAASAQGQPGWSDAFGGDLLFDGSVEAIAFDGEGRVYVGGFYDHVAGMPAYGLARWDGIRWEPLGDPVMDVSAMRMVRDTLYIAGENLTAHASSYQVARWTPDSLFVLGQFGHGCCGRPFIYDMDADSAGNLFVVGNFDFVDTTLHTTGIARWNGARWDSVGEHISGQFELDDRLNSVFDVHIEGSFIYLGGQFNEIGDRSTPGIAWWDGGGWDGIGGEFSQVFAVTIGPDGALYAGGYSDTTGADGVSRVARWDGAGWEDLGSGTGKPYDRVSVIAADKAYVYIAGTFSSADGTPAQNIARWNGAIWEPLGSGVNGMINVMEIGPDGFLYVGGEFTEAGDLPAVNLARWTGEAWESVGAIHTNDGLNGTVHALTGDGKTLYAGGSFSTAGDMPARHIASWDGDAWSSIGTGVNGEVLALTLAAEGTLVAGGAFTEADGQPARRIARWNGGRWEPLGDGFNDAVLDVAVDSVGTIYATGRFTASGSDSLRYVARWEDTRWIPLGNGLPSFGYALAIGPDQAVYAGGSFQSSLPDASYVWRWDGTQWHPLGEGLFEPFDQVLDLDMYGDTLYAAGNFRLGGDLPGSNLARWDGMRWEGLGSPGMNALTSVDVSEHGEVYVGGLIKNYVGRWVSGGIEELDGGVNRFSRVVYSQGQDLFVGGHFTQAGGRSSNFLARWSPSTGTSIALDPGSNHKGLEASFYPNPASRETTLRLGVEMAGPVRVILYDLLGRHVATPIDGFFDAGTHSVALNLAPLSSGAYLYRVVSSGRQVNGMLHFIP